MNGRPCWYCDGAGKVSLRHFAGLGPSGADVVPCGFCATMAERLADLAGRTAAYEARMRATYPGVGADLDCRRANGGMTLADFDDMYAEVDRYNAEERRKALRALWGRPGAWGRDGDESGRGDDWSIWRALQATVGLVFARYWSDEADRRWAWRLGKRYRYSYGHDMAFWDAGPVCGGYTVEVLRLYPGCRIEHFNDGEVNL